MKGLSAVLSEGLAAGCKGREGRNHLKAHLLIGLVVDADSWEGASFLSV